MAPNIDIRSADTELSVDSLKEATASGSAKSFRRLSLFVLLSVVVSYLDRINIGFADLTMAGDLGLSATTFGLANSVFYVAYAAFEIPSNLALARYGAKIWIPRIMITWGLASCLTVFATGPRSLYALRFLVGAAEAGLLPGIILYLSYWFGARDRGRAYALFVAGLPLAMVIGAPLSTVILRMDGYLGIAGWRWLFLLEGIPSIALGIATYFFLVDRPADAKWLTHEQKLGIAATLEKESSIRDGHADTSKFRLRELAEPRVILLACLYFCSVATNNTMGTWLPLVVKSVLGDTNRLLLIGLVSTIVPAFAVIAVPLWSWSSDRRGERLWHLAIALSVSLLGWVMVAMAPTAIAKLLGLTLAAMGSFSFVPVFWVFAVSRLRPATRPATVAVISTAGILASIVSPSVVGVLRDLTHSFTAGCWYVVILNCFAIALLRFATRDGTTPAAPVAEAR